MDSDQRLSIRNMVLFPEGKERGRGAKEGAWEGVKKVCVCVCVNMGVCAWVGRAVKPGVSPVSMCQPISLFLHVTDTHVGTYQPKLLQLMAVPLRCPMCGVLARVTRYGLGSVSPVT